MTLKYKRVPTTYEVYKAIVHNHSKNDLSVYESYTNIVENGLSTIYTVWGLKVAEYPLVGAETKYESEVTVMSLPDGPEYCYDKIDESTRTNEYWLCAPYESEDE